MKNKILNPLQKRFLPPLSAGVIFFLSFSQSYGINTQNPLDLGLVEQKIDVSVSLDLAHEINQEPSVYINVEGLANDLVSHPTPLYYSNQAYIYQVGILNVASQYQASSKNFALIYQEGASHMATQVQQGIQNKAVSVQIGKNHFSFQQQLSSNNLAIAYQIGIGNHIEQYQGMAGGSHYQSVVIQQGNFNRAIVYQY